MRVPPFTPVKPHIVNAWQNIEAAVCIIVLTWQRCTAKSEEHQRSQALTWQPRLTATFRIAPLETVMLPEYSRIGSDVLCQTNNHSVKSLPMKPQPAHDVQWSLPAGSCEEETPCEAAFGMPVLAHCGCSEPLCVMLP